jgi:hypothetical protein
MKNMRMSKYLVMTAAALTLAACSNDDTDVSSRVALKVNADISDVALTRATSVAFEAADEIGVTVMTASTDTKTNGTNKKYVASKENTDADVVFTAADEANTIYFLDGKKVDFSAYFPYSNNLSSNVMTVNAGTDNQTVDGQKTIDLLYGTGSGSVADKSGIKMTFEHLMAKLTFAFVPGSGIDDANLEKLGATYKVEGLIVNGTFDTVKGELATAAEAATALQPASTVKSILLFPQTPTTLKVTLTYDNMEYVAKATVPEGGYAKGTNYAYTLKLNRTGLTVSQSEITDWTSSDQGEWNAEYESSSTINQNSSYSGWSEDTDLEFE